ncbi:unnamed protein product [Leptidea sinapis]|uniref:Uncharacterized protein n=1 Tax=Leptidea sinapis TaxID=189913 RepID=A0A5E4QP53_9NEOP|nr:unnamed protein product [Leptidea sinapis]
MNGRGMTNIVSGITDVVFSLALTPKRKTSDRCGIAHVNPGLNANIPDVVRMGMRMRMRMLMLMLMMVMRILLRGRRDRQQRRQVLPALFPGQRSHQ